jgi:hypothetical protein
LYVEALDQTVFDSKDMADCFVREEIAVQIAHNLMNFHNDLTIGTFGEPNRVDMRIDHSPLPAPVAAHSRATVDMTTFHAIRPNYVLAHGRKHKLHIASVEPIVKLFKKCHPI